jgi:hypothetical protein
MGLAETGYHSQAALKQLAENNIEAYICDNDYRRRDPRFEDHLGALKRLRLAIDNV